MNLLLIDADESNLGLHCLLGAEPPVVLLDSLGGKKGFREKTSGAAAGPFPAPAVGLGSRLSPEEISPDCVSESEGVRLIKIGKIHSAGEGCACPMGRLSKMVFSGLTLGDNDIAVIDTAAGIEHFGRGLDTECDLILCVIDPSRESFLLSEKIAGLAADAGLPCRFILNKMGPEALKTAEKMIDMSAVAGHIDYEESVFLAGLEGEKIGGGATGLTPVVEMITQLKSGQKENH